jgi:nucleoside-diphosphate-sugar epimerase
VAFNEIRVLSDGSPWRPLLHCRDMARAFVAFAEAPAGCGHALAVNVGADAENYQVRDIAAIVHELVPGAAVSFGAAGGRDPRDYRVDFSRLRALLPGFSLAHTMRTGAAELHQALVEAAFSRDDFDGPRYVRLRALRSRLLRLGPAAPS